MLGQEGALTISEGVRNTDALAWCWSGPRAEVSAVVLRRKTMDDGFRKSMLCYDRPSPDSTGKLLHTVGLSGVLAWLVFLGFRNTKSTSRQNDREDRLGLI